MYTKDFCNSYHKIDHNRLPNEMCLLTSYPSLLWSGAWQTSCSLHDRGSMDFSLFSAQ